MTRSQKRMRATLALIGTIIGAGVFGVPAMIGAWGVIPATFGFVLLTFVVLATHLLYAEAVLRYHPAARLSGFADHWLGPAGGAAAGLVQTLQIFGSNLAYLILGGEFLAVLAGALGIHIPVLAWQVAFWAIGSVTILVGLSWMTKVEAFLTWILVAIMILIIGALAGRMDAAVILSVPARWSFEPYGVFLFSLFGLTVIPEMEDIVKERRDDMMKAVMRGTLGAAALTYVFGVTAWLASSGTLGRGPTDVIALLPYAFTIAVPLFGFLAVVTSYLTTAYDLGSMFRLDFHFAAPLAWAVSLGVPLALLFLTERDFLSTIGLVGSIFGATTGVIAVLIGRAALRKAGRVARWSATWWWREVAPLAVTGFFVIGGLSWLFI
ncbi:MAG TPA: aromatic amino acid transport family protein [Candidatus Methylomirabilis sp.]|nr:aromatic amino acid transport family protein [Candidatus Methylomirabilis sp.]